jgi:7-cyano-7-deazaguanine synthase in queuosine biosynthesis
MKYRFRGGKFDFTLVVNKNRLDLVCGDNKWFAEYPFLNDLTGYLPSVNPQYYELMMHVLLTKLDNIQLGACYDIPPSGTPIVSFSGGTDSTACLHITGGMPVHIYRSYAHTYETRQIRAVQEVGAPVIYTDFERIREMYGYRHGFSIGVGYSAMFIPLLPLLKTNRIALGVIFDDIAFNYSMPFSFNTAYEASAMHKLTQTMRNYGIRIECPLAGYSEVLTVKIAKASKIQNVTSCHTLGDQPSCLKCYKCFRKQAILGKPLNWDDLQVQNLVKHILLKNPIKMASSTIYAIQNAGYKDKFFDRYRDIDVSWLERVNDYYTHILHGKLLPGYSYQTPDDRKLIEKFVMRINDPKLYKK